MTSMAFVLWIVSRFQLGEAFSLKPKAKYLVTKGIYSKIRHPVYVFSSLAFLGVAIFLRNHYVFLLLLLFVIIQIIRIKKEEQALLKKFGNKYINYKRKTWL